MITDDHQEAVSRLGAQIDLKQVSRGGATHDEVREGLAVADAVAGSIVEEGDIDAMLISSIGTGDLVVASKWSQRIAQQAQDMGILHFIHAEQVRPRPAVELSDDRGELGDLGVKLRAGPTCKLVAERPLQLVRAPRRGVDVEQILDVPKGDVVRCPGDLPSGNDDTPKHGAAL